MISQLVWLPSMTKYLWNKMFTITIFKIDKAAYFYFIFCQIVNVRW